MITGITPVPISQSGVAPTGDKQSLGKEDFLKLLVAQLAAQDPLSPLEGQEFSAQLAQFSTLEQMTNVNQNLEKIQVLEAALSNSAAINLIGKSIDAPGNTIDRKSDESKSLNYSLAKDATQVTIEIFNITGQKINTITLGDQEAGSRQFIWSGIDASGKPVATGTYRFQVTAEDASGDNVEVQTFVDGRVTDVVFENDQRFVIVNGEKLLISRISRVSI